MIVDRVDQEGAVVVVAVADTRTDPGTDSVDWGVVPAVRRARVLGSSFSRFLGPTCPRLD